jgi:hypothetical protein
MLTSCFMALTLDLEKYFVEEEKAVHFWDINCAMRPAFQIGGMMTRTDRWMC